MPTLLGQRQARAAGLAVDEDNRSAGLHVRSQAHGCRSARDGACVTERAEGATAGTVGQRCIGAGPDVDTSVPMLKTRSEGIDSVEEAQVEQIDSAGQIAASGRWPGLTADDLSL